MVAGVGCVVLGFAREIMAIVYAAGAISFSLMQMSQTYSGNNITLRRLRSLMTIGDLCFIISALLMIENVYHLIFPYIATSIDGYNAYVHYIHNNWVVVLLIGAVFELYTTHRISYEMKKEERGNL